MEKEFTQAEIVKASGEKYQAVASTPKTDRHGDELMQEGWDLTNFKKAPRILWSHNPDILPIGKATKVWVEGTGKTAKLMFEFVFQTVTEMGRAAKQLVDDGFINTFSVGYGLKDMDGNKHTKMELREISLVNVPANPDAMVTAVKSLRGAGIKDETIEVIGIPVVLLDKVTDLEKDVTELKKSVKATPVNPKSSSRQRLSQLKVIAKATDRILAEEKSEKPGERKNLVKIIKKTTEKLIVADKEIVKNG